MIKYDLKRFIRTKSALFWAIAFPIFLLTMFHFVIQNSGNDISVDITISPDNKELPIYQSISILNTTLGTPEMEGGIQTPTYIDEDNTLHLYEKDARNIIVRSIADGMVQMKAFGQNARNIDFNAQYVKNISPRGKGSYDVFYYALLAMIGVYSAYSILYSLELVLANQSTIGIRTEVSSMKRWKLLISYMLSAFFQNAFAIFIIIAYAVFILNINLFMDSLTSIFLIIILLNAFGICLGLFVRVIGTGNTLLKFLILNGSILLLSFLAGLMEGDMRIIILEKAPILSKLNPLSAVTNALFRLNIIGDDSLILPTTITILVEATVLFTISVIIMRRRQYEHL